MKHTCVLAPVVLALSMACYGQSDLPKQSEQSIPLPGAVSGTAVTPMPVQEAVNEALLANPEIRAQVRRLSLAKLKTTTARSLDDPMFMVRDWDTPLRKSWDLNQAQGMFMLQQSFLSKEKRNLRADLAGDDVEVAGSELENAAPAESRPRCARFART